MILSGYTLTHFLLNLPSKDLAENTYKALKTGTFSVHEYIHTSRNDVYKVYINDTILIIKQPKNRKYKSNLFFEKEFFEKELFKQLHSIYQFYDTDNDILVLRSHFDFLSITNDLMGKSKFRDALTRNFVKTVFKLHTIEYWVLPEEAENQVNPFGIFNGKVPILLDKDMRRQEIEILRQFPSYLLRQIADVLEDFFTFSKLEFDYKFVSVIHQDLKLTNIVCKQTKHSWKFDLIDWEMVGIGDFHWDLGIFISSFLQEGIVIGKGGAYPYNMEHPEFIPFIDKFLNYYHSLFPDPIPSIFDFKKKVIFYALIYILEQMIVNIRFKNVSDSKYQLLFDNVQKFMWNFDEEFEAYFKTL